MSGIRWRILIGVAALLAVVALVVLPGSIWVLDRSFHRYEVENAAHDAARLQAVFEDRAEAARVTAERYARRLRARLQPERSGERLLATHVDEDSLRTHAQDFVFLADPQLHLRAVLAIPANREGEASARSGLVRMGEALPARLLLQPRLQLLARQAGSIGLLVPADGRWYLVGASSVTDDDKAPPRGVLGFARELSAERIAALVGDGTVHVQLLPATPDAQAVGAHIDGAMVEDLRTVHDTNGAANAGLRTVFPRPLGEQQQAARIALVIVVLGVLSLGCAVTLLLVERNLIRRMLGLERGLRRMRSDRDRQLPVSARGDEVDRLARGINTLHEALSRGEERWRHEAQHDALTRLGNRRLLLRQLEGKPTSRPEGLVALVLMNLDGFKAINELFGHASGDRVLLRVADAIRGALPAGANGFRLGGDEFAVLLHPSRVERAVELAGVLAQRIPDCVGDDLSGAPLQVSIGVAAMRADAQRRISASDLMHRADLALREAKSGRREGVVLFDDALQAAAQRQRELERELRKALAAGDGLETWFQPIIAAADGRLLRFESLVRWPHPQLGWIEPPVLVATAEASGLAPQLDALMLRNALAALAQIRALDGRLGISVNASVHSLVDEGYVAGVIAACRQAGTDQGALTLEVTETALSSNEALLAGPLQRLQAHGVRFQLDDFGVGYSSLARLAQLDPAGIKLDGSFVRNRHQGGGENLCLAIIGMARQLGMRITAEWVETEEDAAFLRAAGCDALQGFAISAAQPLPELLAWIAQRGSPADVAPAA